MVTGKSSGQGLDESCYNANDTVKSFIGAVKTYYVYTDRCRNAKGRIFPLIMSDAPVRT
jgi:hypothetical protein